MYFMLQLLCQSALPFNQALHTTPYFQADNQKYHIQLSFAFFIMFVIVSERRGGFHRGIVWWLHYLLKIFHSIYFRVLTVFCLNYRIYSLWIYPYNKRGGVTKQRILTCFTK